jgi:hypothetical protein
MIGKQDKAHLRAPSPATGRCAGAHRVADPSLVSQLSAAILSLVLFACSISPPSASPAQLSPLPAIESTESWSFDGAPGQLIRTHSYRLFTTEPDAALVETVPIFLERALDHYTSALGPLPRPTLKLDTFLMADRDQWTRLTEQVMGDAAAPYLRIQRGGFSSGGRALLFTIGPRDTLAIAAHEGWHQYSQRTFRDELPVWLEEGIAVYMEGSTPDPVHPELPAFAPWANSERYEQLVSAAAEWQLLSLDRLLDLHPQTLLSTTTDAALTYYAQAWALTHFLHEGESGKYKDKLAQALSDAASGRIRSTIDSRLGEGSSKLLTRERCGPQLFQAYFNPDLSVAAREYDDFVTTIVKHGNKDRIMSGQSPIDH